MVLNDGETYTSLDGCKIIRVTDHDAENLDDEELIESGDVIARLSVDQRSMDDRVLYVYERINDHPILRWSQDGA